MSINFKKHEVSNNNPVIQGKTYIQLLHGRKKPYENLNNWGVMGPKLGPIDWIHVTYLCNLNIKFENESEETGIMTSINDPMCFYEDMIHYDGVYYGDWEIQTGTPQ